MGRFFFLPGTGQFLLLFIRQRQMMFVGEYSASNGPAMTHTGDYGDVQAFCWIFCVDRIDEIGLIPADLMLK